MQSPPPSIFGCEEVSCHKSPSRKEINSADAPPGQPLMRKSPVLTAFHEILSRRPN